MQRYQVTVNGRERSVELLEFEGQRLVFDVDGKKFDIEVSVSAESFQRAVSAPTAVSQPAPTRKSSMTKIASAGEVLAPMPGVVTKVIAKVGDRVNVGQPILLLEAMKMENSVGAPVAGVVSAVLVNAGSEVSSGAVLARIESAK